MTTNARLKEFCTVTSSKRVYAADYVDDGVPFVRGKEVVRRFSSGGPVESELYISRSKFETLRDRFGAPSAGDLLLTSVGTLGVPYLVLGGDEFYFKDGNLIWFRDFDGLNSRFLYYWLQSHAGRAQLSKCRIGTSQGAYTIERLKEVEVPVLPVVAQQRVAEVLSAYDDLIENNRRRIQLLEESAQLLYNEWFVYLRFPGHEHFKVIDGVPEGWSQKTLPECIALNPKEPYRKGASIRHVPMASLSTSGMTADLAQVEVREKSTAARFRNNDTLLARITPCLENGKTGFVNFLQDGEVACGSTEFIVMRGTLVSPYYTYCLARSHHFRGIAIKSMIGSSGRQRVQANAFDDFPVALPPRTLTEEFDRTCAPIFTQISRLLSQVDAATTARNLLLPRLMNGEVAA